MAKIVKNQVLRMRDRNIQKLKVLILQYIKHDTDVVVKKIKKEQ